MRIGIGLTTRSLAVLIFAQCAAAGVIRHDVADSLYRDLAAEPRYDAVGAVSWSDDDGANWVGSGVYVGDGWVLTAAHVADGLDYAGGGQSNWRINIEGVTYYADEFHVHPDWTASSGELSEGVDIALVKLTTNSVDVEPAILYQSEDEAGQTATFVGFGTTGDGNTGYDQTTYGTKRAGRNVIDRTGGDSGQPSIRGYDSSIVFADFDSPDGSESLWESSTPLDLEYMIAGGDSGGGMFLDADGDTYLAGVISFGIAFDGDVNADYGDAGGFIRVSNHLDWIDGITDLVTRQSTTILDGDFNLDGVVDATDYVIWRDTNGSQVDAWTGADASGDGFVDEDDYEIWSSNYEAGSTSNATAVPEPKAAALAVLSLSASLLRTVRKRRQTSS